MPFLLDSGVGVSEASPDGMKMGINMFVECGFVLGWVDGKKLRTLNAEPEGTCIHILHLKERMTDLWLQGPATNRGG